MAQSLVLGSFNLTATDGSTRVLAEGTTRGNPVPIEVAVETFLQDGAIVVTQGHNNREVHIRVRFFGTDLTALAAKEALLFAELEKPNTLTWTPVNGPASVFEVITSSLDFDDSDDTGEGQPVPWRTYAVRLLCKAFVSSLNEVTVAALAASGTTATLVDDGSVTTNWTGSIDGTPSSPSVVSGAVRVTNGSAVYGPVTVTAARSAAITTSSTKWLVIDWKAESTDGNPDLRAFGDSVELRMDDQIGLPSGLTRTWFFVAASSVTALRLVSSSDVAVTARVGAVRSLYIDNINRTDIHPTIGTGRELQRTIAVAGSARSPGRVAIEHATQALGEVLAYFWSTPGDPQSAAYSPPVRQYRVSGGTVTTDSTAVSGSTEPITTGTIFDIPANALPAGTYLIVTRHQLAVTSGSATLNWAAETRIGSTTVGPTSTGSYSLGTSPVAMGLKVIGRVQLPTCDVAQATTATVRLTLSATLVGGGTTVTFDEGWLFNTTIGQLIQTDCGTGTLAAGGSSNRLFIEPATPAQPRPSVRRGFAADGSDSFFPPTLSAWEAPQLTPPACKVLTVTTNARDASVTFRHYPRWHSNAGS